MNFYWQYFRHINRLNRRSSTAGFTLTEVLLAGMMMIFVVLIAGVGVINMLKSNAKANAESEIQTNVNRAIEFISDEFKQAKNVAKKQIEVDKAVATAKKINNNVSPIPPGSNAVLAFSIPNPDNPGQELSIPNPNNPSQKLVPQVIYYTTAADPDYQLGPRVLWRYGPKFQENGKYNTLTDSNSWQQKPSPVVDMLVDSAQVSDKDCNPDGDDGDDVEGWNPIPEDDSKKDGFFVCVKKTDPNGKKDAKLVLIRVNSEIPIGDYTGGGEQEIPKYSVDTKISTRSGGNFGFKVSANTVVLTEDSTVKVVDENCNAPGVPCKIQVADPDGANLTDRTAVDFINTISGKSGDEISIFTGILSSVDGNIPGFQSVELYTYGQPLPSGISLQTNQVLYVLKDLWSRPNKTYTVVVTIKPR